MGIPLRHTLLTADQEIGLARDIEAGVLAAAVLSGTYPWSGLASPTHAELTGLADLGRRAQHRLLESNLRLVKMVSVPAASRSGVPEEDLFQEGCLGLGDAIRRYDHRRGVRFASFALPWVRYRIGEAVAAANPIRVTAHRREQYRAGLRDLAEAEARLGRHLGERDVLEPGGVSGWAATAARRVLAGVVALDDAAAGALVDPDAGRAFDEIDTCQVPWTRVLARLPERQREVVELRFGFVGEARTVEEVALVLGVSDTTVRRHERRAMASLRRAVDRLGLAARDVLGSAA